MKTSIQKPGIRYGQEPGKALEESAEYHISTKILRGDCSFLRHLSQYKKKRQNTASLFKICLLMRENKSIHSYLLMNSLHSKRLTQGKLAASMGR